jgi:predicted ATP-grasp superfamily ATP-dependent carboligase
VQDRTELFAAARAAEVATPETASLDEWTDWDRDVIVKPRFTLHAPEYDDAFDHAHTHHNSTRYVDSGEELSRSDLAEEMGHVPLVQEYVPDTDEYAFFALYDSGEPVATFQFRQRRGYKYAGGPSAYRESVAIPELDAAGQRLLDHLNWHGLAMVEFLRNPETGRFELMEINPRFWTSLPFSVQAGVDFPYYYWLLTTGRLHDVNPDYEVGIAGHLLRGELLYLHSILFEEYPLVERPSLPGAVMSVLASLLRHPRFDYLRVDDLGPFFVDLRNTIDTTRERIR